MYLSKLEIFGFKSFANKTVVNFTKGITGIVGPNGCGKTNIVDAIRWALGEQKSSTLRSDKMENVIFNGTRDKKPMGMAEVSLTLVNDDNTLPTEYNEITITRRIFRSGESEYLINKNICRLKDITNLFMDTGMGTNAYSVIELKMIEDILSSRTEERRKMFEEAAGVNKYKLRRRLALKKLEEVKGDLTRVNDIVSEVEKNVRSLERQAKKADQYNQIQSVLREKEIDLAEREFSFFAKSLQELVDKRNQLLQEKEVIDSEVLAIETDLVKYRDNILDIERRLRSIQQKISAETEKMHEIQRAVSVANERIKSHERNTDRYTEEIKEFELQLENTQISLEDNHALLADLEKRVIADERFLEEFKVSVNTKKSELAQKKEGTKEQEEKLIAIEKHISSEENKLSNYKNQIKKTNDQITKLNTAINLLTTDMAKTVSYIEELEQSKQKTIDRLHQTEELYAEKHKLKEKLEERLNTLKSEEIDLKSSFNALKDKIEFVTNLITNLEGVSKGVKILIESKTWTDREHTLFADVGDTEEKYKPALEAALKFVVNNLLIENLDELKNAINFLSTNNLGKASFYLLNRPITKKKTVFDTLDDYRFKRRIKKIEAENGFIGWTYDYVKTEEKWKPYFKKVLYNTALVKDIEIAVSLNQKYPSFNFATLNGDIVFTNGIVEAGGALSLEDSLFGRKQMLENLKVELPNIQNKMAAIREEITVTEEELAKIDLKAISEQGKMLENDINTLEKQIAKFEFEKNKKEEEIDKSHSAINELVKEVNFFERNITDTEKNINLLKSDKDVIKNQILQKEEEIKALEEEYNKAVSEFNKAMIELERNKGKINNLRNDIKRGEDTERNIKNTIEKRKKDIENAKEEIITNKNIIEEKEEALEQISFDRQLLINEEKKVEGELAEIKRVTSELEAQLVKLRSKRQTCGDGLHSTDVKMNELNIRLENLTNHIKDEYNYELVLKEYDESDTIDIKATGLEVAQLKNKLKSIGPVNLLAYSEYEEEKERWEFLNKQRNDLIESEKDLIKTIEEINVTAKNLFLEVFEKIRENFKNIFQTLFNPGDEADLTLEEGADVLEGKIEIMAKPKGKRPTTIELLSGGEKTLTAIALLFAIYLVKPSPFCILDEVDAPLDDANIDRFVNLMREFSKNTQFILVTHNKRSMEAAENMYGVTMQEEGISKLVGVQFNEEINVAS